MIKGVGPVNARKLHDLGIWRFSQIAGWSDANAHRVGSHLAFPGRVQREHWVEQARLLAAGVDTEHSRSVKSGALAIDDKADEPLSDAETLALAAAMPDLSAARER